MSFTNEIYNSILQDIYDRKEPLAGIASRMVSMRNGINMVYAVNCGSRLREAYVSVSEKPEKMSFPKWHGTAIDIAQLPAYGGDRYYIRLLQLPESEDYIFDIVIDDLHSTVERLTDCDHCLPAVAGVLLKWKKFFQSEKNMVLSDEMQEGLYGELMFLENSIRRRSPADVHCWTGGNRETHDFYYASHAVEVKTSSKKEPYTAHISSEYQLDSGDVPGHLFLYYIALRKSKSSGERLPQIVGRIRNLLAGNAFLRFQFDEKLRQYGYLDEAADLYATGFEARDTYYFEVRDGFPRIIRSMYQSGISKVVYELMISHCMVFECGEDSVFAALKGGVADAEQ